MLVVTALGGLLGGIVGLILAVPLFAIARNAIARLRSRGVLKRVADRAQPPCNTYSNDVGCSGHVCPQSMIEIATTAHTCGP